jgi:hypothetical protein
MMMKLDIINLIDNFKKFNNYTINQKPLLSHKQSQGKTCPWTELIDNTQNCLIFEHKPTAAIKLFNILLEKGKKGIVITRNHPEKFSSEFVSNNIDMYWLSTEDFEYVIQPWNINLLTHTIRDFIKKNNHGVILLNGLEYLSSYNSIDIICNLILDISKIVVNSCAKFFITIDPIAIGNQFLVTIEKNSELINVPNNSIKKVLT